MRSLMSGGRPSSAVANPSDLPAARACLRVKAPHSRREEWSCCPASEVPAAMGNKEMSMATKSFPPLERSHAAVQGEVASSAVMDARSLARNAVAALRGQATRCCRVRGGGGVCAAVQGAHVFFFFYCDGDVFLKAMQQKLQSLSCGM